MRNGSLRQECIKPLRMENEQPVVYEFVKALKLWHLLCFFCLFKIYVYARKEPFKVLYSLYVSEMYGYIYANIYTYSHLGDVSLLLW